jgi:hypothetical protein
MIPKSNRRAQMRKLLVDNDRPKNRPYNVDLLFNRNEPLNPGGCNDISNSRVCGRNKSNIVTKNSNVLVNQPHGVNTNILDRR